MRYSFIYCLSLLVLTSCTPWDLEKVNFVEVETLGVQQLDRISAEVRGKIRGLNTGLWEQHGFVWSSNGSVPTFAINEGKKDLGQGDQFEKEFQYKIENLEADKVYVVRAYAMHNNGEITYGGLMPFRTNSISLKVDVLNYDFGTEASAVATFSGTETGIELSQVGFCWSTSNPVPKVAQNNFSLSSPPMNDGAFSGTVQLTEDETQYFIRAFILYNFNADTFYSENVLTYTTRLVDVWKKKEPFTISKMIEGVSFSIETDQDTTVFIGLGGTDGFWRYDSDNDSWESIASYPGRSIYGAVAFSIGNKGYVGTGRDANGNRLTEFYEYDSEDKVWKSVMNFKGDPRDEAVGFILSGKGYVGLGRKDIGEGTGSRFRDFYRFNPMDGKWEEVASLSSDGNDNRGGAFAFTINDMAYVGGGWPKTDFWTYDESMDKWNQMNDLPTNITARNVSFTINNKAYIGTGIIEASTISNELWEFDPERLSDPWKRRNDFGGSSRIYAIGFSLQGKGYIGLGTSFGETFDDIWEYIPQQ